MQQARSEPAVRVRSMLYLGRSLARCGYLGAAIDELREAVDAHGGEADAMALELRYCLARCLETAGKTVEAAAQYRWLIRADFDYRDARRRLTHLQENPDGTPPADRPGMEKPDL